ncbi:endolytic transglycosylase MltG [Geodermatophilus sp. SYSU D00710]
MTGPVPPYGGRGRHAVSDDVPGTGSPAGAWYGNRPVDEPPTAHLPVGPAPTGPVLSGRHSVPGGGPDDVPGDGVPGPGGPGDDDRTGPLPTGQPAPPAAGLPPRPKSAWSRMAGQGAADPDATVAAYGTDPSPEDHPPYDPHEDDEATGGLDVLGAGGRDGGRRGRRGRRSAAALEHPEPEHHEDAYDVHSDDHTDEHPVLGAGRRSGSGKRRRGPLANVLALLVLAGLVAGIVFGGRALIGLVNPQAEDYSGAGTGTVEVRVGEGDTLSDIAGTLVDAGVIASSEPFLDAAETQPAAMGIQPGVYSLREQMSGAAALDLLLDPATRQVSRVTVPEGFTVEATLQRIAETTGLPIEDLRAAAADPAALGLPAYANGQLEGFLFPATYDVEPDATAADVLSAMVSRFTETAADLQLEQRAAAAGRSVYDVVVVASMVQSETLLDEERPNVAQVVYNRLAQGIALGIDATLAYGLQKNGNELTVTDLQTDSPYNTRTRAGLPPTPISAPGEASLEAALAPSTGDLLYYVLESQDGRHFFTASYDEFVAARQRCADAGLGCGG